LYFGRHDAARSAGVCSIQIYPFRNGATAPIRYPVQALDYCSPAVSHNGCRATR